MKIAVISDIHGNYSALSSLIQDKEFRSCNEVIFCGDAIGYYFDSEPVVEFLRLKSFVSILGNHDRIFLDYLDGNLNYMAEYSKKYGNALIRAKDNLSPQNIEWLRGLKEETSININSKKILVSHSSPLLKDEYIYQDCSIEKKESLFNLNFDILLLGHTHRTMLFEKGSRKIINPGSIGQSRSQGGFAEWVILDFSKNDVKAVFMQTQYNIEPVIEQCLEISPKQNYLVEVLRRKH